MRGKNNRLRLLAVYLTAIAPLIFSSVAHAEEIQGVSAVQSFIETGIQIGSLLVGSVSVFFVIVGGWRYVTAGNNPEKLDGAKRTLIHAFIGLAIVIAANVLVSIVKQAATNAFGK